MIHINELLVKIKLGSLKGQQDNELVNQTSAQIGFLTVCCKC